VARVESENHAEEDGGEDEEGDEGARDGGGTARASACTHLPVTLPPGDTCFCAGSPLARQKSAGASQAAGVACGRASVSEVLGRARVLPRRNECALFLMQSTGAIRAACA
jgi:hypothetical protein